MRSFITPPLVRDRYLCAHLVLVLVGIGWLALGQSGARPSAVDWSLGLVGLAASPGGRARPLAVTLAQSLLLVLAEIVGDSPPITAKVLVAVALFELAACRRRDRDVVVGTVVVGLVYAVILLERPHADVAGSLYRLAVIVGAPLMLGVYVHSTRRLLYETREHAAEAERRRELADQAIRTAERTAISREIHDLVAHHVASIVLRVGVARHVIPAGDAAVREVLDDVHETATEAMDDLRQLVRLLRDCGPDASTENRSMAPEELLPALHEAIERGRPAGARMRVEVDPSVREVDPLRALALLRVVQEGLANVARHGGSAPTVRVVVGPDPTGATRVEIGNHGGATPTRPRDGASRADQGLGLVGLRERMTLLGGTLRAGPDPGPDPTTGKGWLLVATLPAAGAGRSSAAPVGAGAAR
ncbi:sensor histidine kinase [Embleya sp. NPDC056538]|uniref:sensor histidine kinase n=1 Tax=Embleya sp. NPDC056538 TaxID=3345858 RepID=UPI0036B2BEAA